MDYIIVFSTEELPRLIEAIRPDVLVKGEDWKDKGVEVDLVLIGAKAVQFFRRLGGNVVGFVANNSAVSSGQIDCDSALKIARFVRFCNIYNIPLIFMEDTTGFLPGREQEARGIVQAGRSMLDSIVDVRTPRILLILRNAYGGAYASYNNYPTGADLVLAARGKRKLEELAEELRDKTRVEIFPMDVADSEACADVFRKAEFEFGRIECFFLHQNRAHHANKIDIIRSRAELTTASGLGLIDSPVVDQCNDVVQFLPDVVSHANRLRPRLRELPPDLGPP